MIDIIHLSFNIIFKSWLHRKGFYFSLALIVHTISISLCLGYNDNMTMPKNIFTKLTALIEASKAYIIDGSPNKNLLAADARKYNKDLLNILQKHKDIKEHFFTETDGGLVFKKDVFLQFISNKEFLPNSFTKYKIKIGLGSEDGSLLHENGEVVLNWPYKDAILEGGQDKEDQKRKEILHNEILAPDQITRLLDDKVFTNWKRFDQDGEHQLDSLQDTDNLLLKGNNLVVLHSLRKRFAGKVKLIYIDPPYNTGSDSFGYNDSFNHSTWLTFMKNRLEIAHKLLSDDGAIFISINQVELGYLLVMLDEIFGRPNRLPIVTLRAGTTASYRSINVTPVNVTEFVISYSKSNKYKPNTVYRETGYTEDYSHFIKNIDEDSNEWSLESLTDVIHRKHNCSDWREFKKKIGPNWKNKRFEEMQEFAFLNKESVVSLNTLQKPSTAIKRAIEESKKIREKVFSVERNNAAPIYCYNGRTLAFFGSKFKDIDGDSVPAEIITNLWTDISFLGIGPEGGVTLANGKKPEFLIKTILDIASKPGDLVLDYHLGSGTTAAVAQKMGRQFIGIEQLFYGNNDPAVRLKNVIEGDQSGISKTIDWRGGGSFVYANVMNNANEFRQRVEMAKNDADYAMLLEEAASSSFMSYRVDPTKFSETEFRTLSIAEKRQLLLELIDNNTLYVNYEDINDPIFKVSDEDKKHNKELYKKTNE
jgi:adenine-specific DNA-methyltransferase